ncbi:helix-turn-helix domain-containing protein [Anaerocolumna chitinilytica]|uniref:HTH cro/C1-type domain-containing protein n=1 Tax=Anaerocolumna chitinilytica TaxID=1727145 RepID=A0A7I8DLY7_9FIRM|nr:helix-turn-helix domain-containing protein [Anaerocolumna chitinilytica]BCJ99463.1 hypothetical protein bsdcttw_25040 [Anaerocolumna chitinilytica]
MEIKICNNIAKYRKENEITQAELAEYLGVSPQAVSKWEQEISIPDIYLIPKIAYFFNISIDTLFGTSNFDTTELLVSKYSAVRNDKNYKEAKEAIDALLDMNPEDLKALSLLCRLEHQRSLEYLHKSIKACEKLKHTAKDKDTYWENMASIQLMRENSLIGNYDFLNEYIQKFEENKTADNFNYFLLAITLSTDEQYKKALKKGKDYIDSFTFQEQLKIYPNLMEIAYSLEDFDYVRKCFDVIIKDTENKDQIFNAWWLLWKSHKSAGKEKEAEDCRKKLLNLLPAQNYNEYLYEEIERHLLGEGDKPEIIW